MKTMKKLAGLMLAMVMVIAMAVPVFADNNYTISIAEGDTHTYAVYQIFTGDLSESVLSNIKWGSNATSTGTVSDEVLNAVNEKSGSELSALVYTYLNTSSTQIATISLGDNDTANDTASVVPGYYLIKDASTIAAGSDDSYTQYIVQVVKDVTITRKAAKPTVDKTVYDNNDGVDSGDGSTGAGFYETADHAIGESYQYKLVATLGTDTDYDAYKTYKLVFNDSMSDGVTFESIASVTVSIGGSTYTIPAANYVSTAAANTAGAKWTLTINDLYTCAVNNDNEAVKFNSISGAVVTVTYNAHLNENAVVNTDDDNKNTVYLEYSNNPNYTGEGVPTGKTEEDTVYVFTYTIDNTKVDEKKKILPGAGFTLYTSYNAETGEYSNPVTLYLKTTTTGEGDEAVTTYTYYKYDAKNSPSGTTTVTEMTSQANGTFNIRGLDVGTYYLVETKAPAGYNTANPVKVEITATHNENDNKISATCTLTNSKNTTNEIVDQSGSTLPTTGGIGTTLFYVIGGLLVLCAGVVLVVRRRMA